MSGIAAILHVGGSTPTAGMMADMLAAMAYRGPDSTSQWQGEAVVLGHCALHSTAESQLSQEPLWHPEHRLAITLDGYLTNRDELARALEIKGLRGRDGSDAELMLLAYAAWGCDCAERLEGEFAFIICDERRAELFCARDHQGLRPLLYHWDGRRLVVASDIAGILTALPRRPAANEGYLVEMLSFEFFTRDETVWSGIKRLPQAHAMRVDANGPRVARYWQLPLGKTIRYARDADYAEHYREVLADSVRRTARSDRPLAVEVSGGLDSTSLYCMAHREVGAGRLPAPALRGYTMAGPVGTHADEIAYVRAVATQLSTQITELPFFMPELDWFAADARRAQDIPLFPNGVHALLEERRVAQDGCRAVMNGVGGDQWLYGTPYYYREIVRSFDIAGLARALAADRRDAGSLEAARLLLHYGLGPNSPRWLLAGARAVRARLSARAQDQLPDWLSPAARDALAARRARWREERPDDPEHRQMLEKFENPWWSTMNDINARQAAMSGLDPRYPMLTRPFITFCAAVPERQWRRGGDLGKLLHREALAGILPDKVRLRTDAAVSDVVFRRHTAVLCAQLRTRLHPEFLRLVSERNFARLIEGYCDAAIDSYPVVALWAPYVVNTILHLPPEGGGLELGVY